MWLAWDIAAWIGVALGVVGWATRNASNRWTARLRPFVWEATLIFLLYALWQWGGRFNLMKPDGALARGDAIWRLQRWLHLPSELSLQRAVLPHPLLVKASNIYYAVAHVPALIIFLIWLFAWHRERYPVVRTVLAFMTAASLGLHLIPVAPPRMFPGLGFVDTALLYNQSVYGAAGAGVSDQLGAMPSLHVGWAVLVGLGAVWAGRSRWRWLALAHPILTLLAVTDTANHWWLDGVGAVLLIPPAWWLHRRAVALIAARRAVAAPKRELELTS